LVLVLLLNNGASNESFSKPPTSDMQNNQTTIAASDIPTAQLTYFPSANPSDVPSEHTIYLPSLIPSVHNRSAHPTSNPSAFLTYLPSAYLTYLPSLIPSEVKILSPSTALEIFVPLSGEESLKNKKSPQYLAMDWIVNHDGANMTLTEVDKIIQRYALAVLYYSTQGKSWKHQLKFLSDKNVCEWKGFDFFNDCTGVLECNKEGNVVQLELWFENLTGTIPSELGLLTELKDLNLARNNLFGKVPVSLSMIPTLNEVDLIWNDLTGSMEHFCTNDIKYDWLSADCLRGNNTKIQCSCCHPCNIVNSTKSKGNNRFLEN